MREKYYPPIQSGQEFHCYHCGVFASQYWETIYKERTGATLTATGILRCVCRHCKKESYWYAERMIIPAASFAEPPHPDLPTDCLADYVEASTVVAASPRSAAALLRLCIQKLMPHLGEKGKNINDDIASLVAKGLPPLIQMALDYCRVVGNNAVHPGELDLNDTPEIAHELFRLINFIVDTMIARPKELEALYNTLPQGARDAIDKRDNKL
ncbi:MAG TPA: DUF4145 domain-containing protein [Pyrinomonadaceae bacterium]|jgi:hypothetical protein